VTHTIIQEIVVGIFVIFMMMAVGLDLTLRRVMEVFKYPKALMTGMGINYLLVPLVALGLVRALEIPPLWAGGLLVGAMAPGGPVGAVLTQSAKGNVALAVSLTVVMNCLNTLVTPVMVWATDAIPVAEGANLPVLGMIRTIVLFQLIPLGIAMIWRAQHPSSASRVHEVLKKLARIVLALAVAGMLISNRDKIGRLDAATVGTIVTCTVVGLGAGWFLTSDQRPTQVALSLTSGIRSMSVALLLVTSWFPDPEVVTATVAYSGIMFTTTWAYAQFLEYRAR